jgi:DNA-binding response OmpR family regulator
MTSSRGITIYEDDSLTRALLKEWLADAGYRVHLGDARHACAETPCDLVIVSVYMPKHSGVQCVREVRAAHPDTPVIAISGQFRRGLEASGATAQALGVQQVVAKPLTRDELLASVRGIIDASP